MSTTKNISKSDYWDKVVRSTHWCVALGFLINRLHVTLPGSDWHKLTGMTICLLVILRLIWGLTLAKGPARLSAMIPSIKAIIEHIDEVKQRTAHQHLGHNALGILSIWAIWFGLLLIGFTGWAQSTNLMDRWPVDEWHYWLVNLVTIVVCLHILAVILLSIWLKRDLLAAMLPQIKKR